MSAVSAILIFLGGRIPGLVAPGRSLSIGRVSVYVAASSAACVLRGFFSVIAIMSANDREEKIQEVLMIFRHKNFMRCGVSDVDESYVRSLRDSALDDIIERDRILREREY